jgi:hypothetical protein
MDAEAWKEQWPKWAFPIVTGGSANAIKICVGLPVWAAVGEGAVMSKEPNLPPLNTASRLAETAEAFKAKVEALDPFKEGFPAAVKKVQTEAQAAVPDAAGLVFINAQEIFDKETGTYAVNALDPEARLTVNELLDLYASIVEASEGWVKVIVGPFSREDQLAHERLKERLPGVNVLCNFGENFEAPVKYEGCSYLADFRSASAMLEQLERIGGKFLAPAVASVPQTGAQVPCTLDSILAMPSVEYIMIEDGVRNLDQQFHEAISALTVTSEMEE